MGALGRPRSGYRGLEPHANGAADRSCADTEALSARVADELADIVARGPDLKLIDRNLGAGRVPTPVQLAGINAAALRMRGRRRQLEAERLSPQAILKRCGNPPGPLPAGTSLVDWYVAWTSTMDAHFGRTLKLAARYCRTLPAGEEVSVAAEVIYRVSYRILCGQTFDTSPEGYVATSSRNEAMGRAKAELGQTHPERTTLARRGSAIPTRVYLGDDGISPLEGLAGDGSEVDVLVAAGVDARALFDRVLSHPGCTARRAVAVRVMLAAAELGRRRIPPSAWVRNGLEPRKCSQLLGDTRKWIKKNFPEAADLV